ncbi:MAG: hypothetical protein M1480_16285 [Bacteroidetes bacterium]|nr:hypothetical protein [Bacteroidota bacterium]
MKNSKFVLIVLMSSALLFNACKSNSTAPQTTNGTGSTYFPNSNGTYYKYSVVKTDSTGAQASGTRSTTYNGTTTLGSTTYQNEIDTITFGNFSTTSTSLFVKNNNGVYFAIDTSGLSETIPDSLKQYIQMDAQLTAFQFPFQDGVSWPAFSMSLKLGTLTFNLVKVMAYYQGVEQIPLNLSTGTVTKSAAKIQYILTLSVPNLSNPFAAPTTSNFTAYAWLVDNVGVAQMQGNGTILDAFTGGGIHFADTTSTVTQSLISYNIK